MDVAVAVWQARHTVPDGHELRAELDRLFTNARTWVQQLVDVDSALGDSTLAHMPTPAARRPPTLGARHMSNDEVRHAVSEQLDRLAEQRTGGAGDVRPCQMLDRVNAELQVHLDALNQAHSCS